MKFFKTQAPGFIPGTRQRVPGHSLRYDKTCVREKRACAKQSSPQGKTQQH